MVIYGFNASTLEAEGRPQSFRTSRSTEWVLRYSTLANEGYNWKQGGDIFERRNHVPTLACIRTWCCGFSFRVKERRKVYLIQLHGQRKLHRHMSSLFIHRSLVRSLYELVNVKTELLWRTQHIGDARAMWYLPKRKYKGNVTRPRERSLQLQLTKGKGNGDLKNTLTTEMETGDTLWTLSR